jgi:hypothetical protein
MLTALLAAYITKAPAWVQGAVFGLCVGLFVAAGANADTRDPLIGSVVLLVLTVAVVTGGAFYLALRARLRRRALDDDPPAWVHLAYVGAWLLSVAAAARALFGAGGLAVAVLAVVPIVLLVQPALAGIHALRGRPAHGQRPAPATPPAPGPGPSVDPEPTLDVPGRRRPTSPG